MNAQMLLAESILACKGLLGRYLAGFSDENRTRQAPGLPNHVAWSLGHLALTMHRVAERIDGRPMPAADFVAGPAGDAARFGTESVAFGSTPVAESAGYPSFARCVAIYDGACNRLAAAVREAGDAKMAEVTRWGAGETTISLLCARMVFHNGTHTGQIADLRRALGFKGVLG